MRGAGGIGSAGKPMLLFKKKFLEAIRAGHKTQTVRLWKHRRMRAGQRSYIPGAGYIQVLSVEVVELADLTDDDARPDGFASVEALRAELAALYPPEVAAEHQAYRVRFALDADQQPAPTKRRRAGQPRGES